MKALRAAWTGLATLVLALAPAAPALAHRTHDVRVERPRVERHVHARGPRVPRLPASRRVVVRPVPVVVPRFLGPGGGRAYAAYRVGTVFYAPHGHYHAIYRFPMRGARGVLLYQDRTYCAGELFLDAVRPGFDGYVVAPSGPRFHIDVRF